MKHFNVKALLLAAGALLGFGSAAAQAPAGMIEVPNYLEKFSSGSVASSRLNHANGDPLGWNQVIDQAQSGSTTYKMDYATTSSGKDGYAIGTTSSSWIRKNYSTNEVFNLYDYLVTPQVKGNINFWIKRYSTTSSYPPKLQLYKMHKQADGTFTCDTIADRIDNYNIDLTELLPNTSEWKEQTFDVGDEFCYVGIRMAHLYFDEFGADAAMLPVKKDIELGNITFLPGYSSDVNATEDGKWKLGVQIEIKNKSNVPLYASQEGENYTITLKGLISQSPNTWVDLVTVPLPDLEINGSAFVTVEETFDIPEGVTINSNYGTYRVRTDFYENFTGKDLSKTGSWIDIMPFISLLDIRYDKKTSATNSNDTQVDATKIFNFGSFKVERSIEFRLRNRGAAPLEFVSIEKPDWVTIENMPEVIPVELNGAAPVSILVKISGEPGYKSGKIKFNTNGDAFVREIPLAGEVVGENQFFADFENEDAMSPWFTPDVSSNWKVADYSSTERNYSESFYPVEYNFNDKRLENTYQTPVHYIYSPKQAFKDGDQISFYAAKKSNSGDIKLEVKYSEDRANWVELGTITVTNDDPDLQFSSGTSTTATSNGQNILKRFAFDMPAGEYYIALGAGYVLVDNFVGGELVPVDYDIAPLAAEAGKTRIVNNPLTFSATFRNLADNTIAAGDYSAVLYANGKKVAEAEADDFNGLTSKTFNFEYTPHVAGETDLYAELVIGEYSVASPTVSVMVQEESATVKTTIGTVTKTENTVPLGTGYYNSKSEFVYTKEDLALLNNNSKILKISYPYYRSSDLETPRLTIWMENTTDTQVGDTFKSTEGLTEVYTTKAYTFEAKGSSTDLEEMEFVLDVPFLYEGNNLRVIIESAGQSSWNATSFGVDGSNSSRITRYYRVDSADTYEKNKFGAGSKAEYYPVINIYTEKELAPVAGTVKDDEGKALEGATVTVKATDGDVFYTAETDVDGNWSLTIFQNELTYTVSADKAGYFASAPEALDWTASNDLELVEDTEEVPVPEEESVTSNKNDNELYDIVLVWKHSSEVKGVKRFAAEDAEYTYKVNFNGALHGTTNDNTYTISNVSTGVHTVEVIAVRNASGKESVAMAKTLDIGATGVADVEVEEGQYRYFNLNGVEVRGENLERGIYIRVKGKKAEKILVNN